jgi:hypothetical protein
MGGWNDHTSSASLWYRGRSPRNPTSPLPQIILYWTAVSSAYCGSGKMCRVYCCHPWGRRPTSMRLVVISNSVPAEFAALPGLAVGRRAGCSVFNRAQSARLIPAGRIVL